MKKIMTVLVVVTLVLYGTCAVAADKTGFINVKSILFQSQAGKDAAQELKKIVDKKKVLITEKEEALKALKADLEKQRTVLTESAYKEKELDYQKKFRDYKRFIEDSNDEMQLKEQELFQKLIPEIMKVVSSIGEKDNYTMIVDIGTGLLPYYSKAKDITEEVIEKYNKEYGKKK
jgi:outer membrane protein